MKKLLLLCFLTITANSFAQMAKSNLPKPGVISGKVVDDKTKEPLPYVNIVVRDAAKKILTGGITDDNGKFKIKDVPEGKSIVEVQFIGYETFSREITITNKSRNLRLGTIPLKEASGVLDEVVVRAETSTVVQKVDRKVINIGKDLGTSGTAADIMLAVPSVNVDTQTGNISLRGNQNVQVMIDGKLSNIPTAQLLRQLPANSIKQIELITNPSAKYNPEGLSGFINIILKKNTNLGFNGNLNAGYSYQREPKFTSSIDGNYRNGKFNLYGTYSNNLSRNSNIGNISQVAANSSQSLDILDDRDSHLFKVGLDFYLNEKNTLSVFTNQNLFNGDNRVNTGLVFRNAPINNQDQVINSISDNTSSQYNFNYKLDFDKQGHNIELEVDHNAFNNDINTINTFTGNNVRPNFNEFTDTNRDRTTINLDYVNPLSKGAKLELGLQARLFQSVIGYNSDFRNQNAAGQYIPTRTSFDYSRDIYSAYFTYGKQLKKWGYQFGLRAETVTVDAFAVNFDLNANTSTPVNFENDYVQVYPSGFLTYRPSDKNSFQLNYSRRVDRPGVGQVNPIPQFNTPLVSQFGNQELRPQFTNSFEANYTRKLKKGTFTGGIFYRLIQDEINTAVFVDRSDLGSGRIILTSDNFDNTSAFGFELSSNYRATKWWSLNASFDLFSQVRKGFGETLDPTLTNPTETDIKTVVTQVDNVAWNFRVFNNFRVSKKLTFTAFALYRGRERGLQFEVEPIYFLNLGMRYNFIQNGTFAFNVNDVLNTQRISVTAEQPFLQTAQFSPEFRIVSAQITYRFGGGKFRAKSRKRRKNDEKSGGGFF